MADTDDNATIQQMREQLRAYKEQVADLTQQRDLYAPLARAHTFSKVGIDPDSDIGRTFLLAYGDRPLTPDAVGEWAKEQSINLDAFRTQQESQADPEAEQRTAATQRIAELRASSTPVGTQRMSYADYQALKLTNTPAAVEAFRSGLVDMPADRAAALAHNRSERNNQLIASGGDV